MRIAVAIVALVAGTASAEHLGDNVSHTSTLGAHAQAPGDAPYGLQRTATSGRVLWRDSGCIDLVFDADSVTAPIAKVLDESMAAWTAGTATCGGIVFSHSFASGITADADGISTVHVRTTHWDYAPDAAAVTHVRYVDDPTDDNDGRIVEADMEINAVDYTLLLPGDAPPANPTKPVLYLRAVTTHEMGHLLGLGHDCGTGTEAWPTDRTGDAVPACASAAPDVQAATMYYQVGELDDGPSTLEASDVAGACAIAAHLTCAPEIVGTGCNAGGSPSGASLVVGALLLLRRRRRREA